LYQLERSIDGGSFFYISMDTTTSRTHTYPSAATLKFRVRGCNAYGGCGTYSAEQTMVVSAAPPPPPPAFGTPTLTASSQTGVGAAFSVSWTAVAGATQYVLERKNGSGAYAVIYSGGGTTPSQTMVFYSATNTLKHRVKACDTNNNCGSYSNEATTQVIASGGGGGGCGIEP
jgi:hypothetical protein